MPPGKLKVRGAFKASVFAFSVAIGINFGRIFRLLQGDPPFSKPASLYFTIFSKSFSIYLRKSSAYFVLFRNFCLSITDFSKLCKNLAY